MSRCPTFNFQLSIMAKLLAKHVSNNVSFKLLLGKFVLTLKFVGLEYETSVSIWEFEMIIVLK